MSEKQKHQLPEYLRKPSLLGKLARFAIERTISPEISGRENIPDEECLVLMNHWGGRDVEALFNAFAGREIHITAGQHGNMETPWGRVARLLGMVSIDESLGNLSQGEVEQTASWGTKTRQQSIVSTMNQDPMKRTVNIRRYLNDTVALLERGDAVAIFPEGVFTEPPEEDQPGGVKSHQKAELRQGYRGLELIAQMYEKKTGKSLKILPVAYLNTGDEKTINIGQPITRHDNKTDMNLTDFSMTKVAALLPEENRGYYADKIS